MPFLFFIFILKNINILLNKIIKMIKCTLLYIYVIIMYNNEIININFCNSR